MKRIFFLLLILSLSLVGATSNLTQCDLNIRYIDFNLYIPIPHIVIGDILCEE